MLDAVKRLMLREVREQPLVLIFEDLHWIDSETQAFLDTLVDSLGSARLLLLVNYRPEYQHTWGSKTCYSQIRLDALLAESAGELLDALLGDDPGLIPLKQLLVKRGNPFFLEETVRTLVETKALALAEPRGMRPLVAHCHLGLGKLYRRTGKREQAQEHLATAMTMYRDMGMRFWLEQAEAELKESQHGS
jgi:hypothetical protein